MQEQDQKALFTVSRALSLYDEPRRGGPSPTMEIENPVGIECAVLVQRRMWILCTVQVRNTGSVSTGFGPCQRSLLEAFCQWTPVLRSPPKKCQGSSPNTGIPLAKRFNCEGAMHPGHKERGDRQGPQRNSMVSSKSGSTRRGIQWSRLDRAAKGR